MPLSDFREQYPELCRTLMTLRSRGRAGHAYLFTADDNELAEKLVRAWLQSFVCRHPGTDGNACDRCDRCLQFHAASYPHLHVLQPLSRSRQIVIDDVRGFEHHLHLTAGGKAFKIGMVMEADRLNEQAQNALLKTLEEPPPATIIVLISSHPRALLPTIRSRCQTVSLLKNRRSYLFAVEQGLFPILATMKRGAGALIALTAARRLRQIFAGLEKQAEDVLEAGETSEENKVATAEQDPRLDKKLKEIRAARLAAEYRGLRNQLTEAIHCWYLQRLLAVAGVDRELLPHPEILAAVDDQAFNKTDMEESEAAAAVAAAERLMRQLNGNMDEKLAIQAFCLELCEKL